MASGDCESLFPDWKDMSKDKVLFIYPNVEGFWDLKKYIDGELALGC